MNNQRAGQAPLHVHTHHFFPVTRTVVSTLVTKLISMDTTSSFRDLVASYVSATRFSVSAAMRSVSVPLVPMYCAACVGLGAQHSITVAHSALLRGGKTINTPDQNKEKLG